VVRQCARRNAVAALIALVDAVSGGLWPGSATTAAPVTTRSTPRASHTSQAATPSKTRDTPWAVTWSPSSTGEPNDTVRRRMDVGPAQAMSMFAMSRG
jgi:hypothetical protein